MILTLKEIPIKKILLCVFLCLSFNGCKLSRDNPLDPDAFNYGSMADDSSERPTLTISSFHSSQWFPTEDIYTLEALVEGYLSGIADSAVLIIDGINSFSMEKQDDKWRASIESSKLSVSSISDLIGIPIYATLRSNGDSLTSTDEAFLFRVIGTVPQAISPSGGISVNPRPEFSWIPLEEPFSFTYSLSIFHVSTSGFVSEVLTDDELPMDSSTHTLTDSLPPYTYYWTISIVDNLGNVSRSKEAAFTVNP